MQIKTDNSLIYSPLRLFLIIGTVSCCLFLGGSFAYFNWRSSQIRLAMKAWLPVEVNLVQFDFFVQRSHFYYVGQYKANNGGRIFSSWPIPQSIWKNVEANTKIGSQTIIYMSPDYDSDVIAYPDQMALYYESRKSSTGFYFILAFIGAFTCLSLGVRKTQTR
jgi:hypothetical protein